MRRRLLCEQRGTISLMAAMSLLFILPVTALTVDIGQAAWKKRDLQKMVDVVSLDAVRAVGDRRDPLKDHYVQALELAQDAATRNGFVYTNTAAGNSLAVELGVADHDPQVFTPSASGTYATANAVRVTATHTNNNRFMPGDIPIRTQAIAMIDQTAMFSVGSRLLRLDTSTSPILNRVLG